MAASLRVWKQQHRPDSRARGPELSQLLEQVATRRNDPCLADFVVLRPPTNDRLLEVHVVPAQREDSADATPRAPCNENQRTQERMYGRSHREQGTGGSRIEK